MAPSKGKAQARSPKLASRRRTRANASSRHNGDGARDVYQEMLDELPNDNEDLQSDRPLKRRKVVDPLVHSQRMGETESDTKTSRKAFNDGNVLEYPSGPKSQTAEQTSDEDSDFEFEDVDLAQAREDDDTESDADVEIQDISVSVGQPSTPARKTVATHRKPPTAVEKAFRLMVHKAHFLCLLGHCMFVNSWCNNTVVHKHIRGILSKRAVMWFDDKSDSQAARHLTFVEALQKCRDDFSQHFHISASGMRKARWTSDHDPANVQLDEEPQDLSAFITAAKKREGSQDTGNQLFCALLRSLGIETRLVCSLQVLPLNGTPGKGHTPRQETKKTIHAITPDGSRAGGSGNHSDGSVRGSKVIGVVPSARRRLGQPAFAGAGTSASPLKSATPKKEIRKLSYPVCWTEAFDTAYQKWIPVDPIVTRSVNKPMKLEPPSTYHDLNQLVYAIALESDGVAKDVTRRYAKAYNAKTRRQRVESTENGSQWLSKALKVFRPKRPARDRDQVEDAELSQKEAREGLPVNVQDFKGHPHYALERHLKRHEVIHPRREVGKINAGTAAKPRMEAVFRRQDVVMCRSADKWFRLGREVIPGEQALKHANTTRRVRESDDLESANDTNVVTRATALYSVAQTAVYVPPPVVRGLVPRNGFGNLDLYVPSMVPSGGTHIRHTLARQAARLLNVDCVDAVTGFQFKNRRGVAIIDGVVVPSVYAEAVEAVIDGMIWSQEEEDSCARSLTALKLWKKFLAGLKIRERVDGLGDADRTSEPDSESVSDQGVSDITAPTIDDKPLPTAGWYSVFELNGLARKSKKTHKIDSNNARLLGGEEDAAVSGTLEDLDTFEANELQEFGGGGFLPSDTFVEESNAVGGKAYRNSTGSDDDIHGGGFLIPDEDTDQVDDLDIDPSMPNDVPENASRPAEGGGFRGVPESGEESRPMSERQPSAEILSRSFEHKGSGDSRGQQLLETIDDDKDWSSRATERPDAASTARSEVPTPAYTESLRQHEPQLKHLDDQLQPQSMRQEPQDLAQGVAEMPSQMPETFDGSDRGSLLSHDPEDEDAEPDWLESD